MNSEQWDSGTVEQWDSRTVNGWVKQTMKIGVLGGTFDPPHCGHLKIAEVAMEKLGLARVIFAPAGNPPHKQGQKISEVKHRLEMVRLAIADDPRFVLSRADAERERLSYTVNLVRRLRREFPNAEFYFIMGLDSLASILTWHQPAELIRLCKLAVLSRPGVVCDLGELESKLPGLRERVEYVDSIAIDISATEIQRRVRAEESIAGLVPDAVARYVEREGLYRE